jgi:hypothetical protein
MNLLKYLFLALLAFLLFTLYAKYGRDAKSAAGDRLPVSEAGFATLPPTDLPDGKAVILTASNFSKEDRQRARELDFQLMQAGIPREMRSEVHFTGENPGEAARMKRYLESLPVPCVFVRGKVKGNPTVMEIVSEYRGVPLRQAPQEKKE